VEVEVLRKMEAEAEPLFATAKSIFPSLFRSPMATEYGLVPVVDVACVANVVLVVAIPKFGTERLSMMIEMLDRSYPVLALVPVHESM
jgi:hypothetical protein